MLDCLLPHPSGEGHTRVNIKKRSTRKREGPCYQCSHPIYCSLAIASFAWNPSGYLEHGTKDFFETRPTRSGFRLSCRWETQVTMVWALEAPIYAHHTLNRPTGRRSSVFVCTTIVSVSPSWKMGRHLQPLRGPSGDLSIPGAVCALLSTHIHTSFLGLGSGLDNQHQRSLCGSCPAYLLWPAAHTLQSVRYRCRED